jgi:predicted membrane channel-forming protein YqfA (hemolysin III family)
MRTIAFLALIAGAAGSVGLLLHAKQHPPPLLIVLFVIWVLAPFACFGVAYKVSTPWPSGTQATLYIAIVFVALASLLVYGDDALHHRTPHPAFVYVAVPPVSGLLAAIAVSISAFKARRK